MGKRYSYERQVTPFPVSEQFPVQTRIFGLPRIYALLSSLFILQIACQYKNCSCFLLMSQFSICGLNYHTLLIFIVSLLLLPILMIL